MQVLTILTILTLSRKFKAGLQNLKANPLSKIKISYYT